MGLTNCSIWVIIILYSKWGAKKGCIKMGICRTDCFGYWKNSHGTVNCRALQNADCRGCKFFKTQEDYNKNVKPLKHYTKK